MKKMKFIGKLTNYKHLNCSVYGNPAFYGEFVNSEGETLKGRTASNAMCAYGFLNQKDYPREITYHITKAGNIIFDYIDIIK